MFANVLLVRYGSDVFERIVECINTTSVTTHGRYEGYLVVSDATTEAEGRTRGDALLASLAQEQRDIAAAVLTINDWDVPYVFYGLGNTVSVPDENNNLSSERVLAISISEDDNTGIAGVTLGLRQVVLGPEERISRALDRALLGSRDSLANVARRSGG